MERLSHSLAALVLALSVSACATPTPPAPLVVAADQLKVNRPQLAIETLPDTATTAEVFSAYEQSLMVCIGYAKQLEAAQATK